MTNINYLYDNEDVLQAPGKYVGLANSSVQLQEERRNKQIATVTAHSIPFEELVASKIPSEKE